MICGGGLLKCYDEFLDKCVEGIYYLGFVEDIENYVLVVDFILNFVNVGGGVKIKLVEVVVLGKIVVLIVSGVFGVDVDVYGFKFIIVFDMDWDVFV